MDYLRKCDLMHEWFLKPLILFHFHFEEHWRHDDNNGSGSKNGRLIKCEINK